MTRRASSMVAAGPPKRPKGTQRSFRERPVEDVEQPVVAFDRVDTGDRRSHRHLDQREAAIAALRGDRAGVELEGFDRVDDLLIRHRVIVTDRCRAVSARVPVGRDSKCLESLA